MSLSIERIVEVSRSRCKRWHHEDTVPWTGADWSNAMAGECGEACNAVKKMRRIETGTMGAHNGAETDVEVLRAKIGEELADTILYAVLVADHYEIDLAQSIIEKFDLVSVESGFPERLAPACRRCGGTDDLMDRAMAPGMTYCKWCRAFLAVRNQRDRLLRSEP